jgi:hypothetical protein
MSSALLALVDNLPLSDCGKYTFAQSLLDTPIPLPIRGYSISVPDACRSLWAILERMPFCTSGSSGGALCILKDFIPKEDSAGSKCSFIFKSIIGEADLQISFEQMNKQIRYAATRIERLTLFNLFKSKTKPIATAYCNQMNCKLIIPKQSTTPLTDIAPYLDQKIKETCIERVM